MAMMLLFGALLLPSSAHVQMIWPPPIRSPFDGAIANSYGMVDYNLKSPVSPNSEASFPCHGYHRDASSQSVAALVAGEIYNLTLVGSATHGGGSCQISLSYDRGLSWQVIKSVIGGCPSETNLSYSYKVPRNAPQGTALLAWTWLNLVGNREFYMNCALVDVLDPRNQEQSYFDDNSPFQALPGIYVANLPYINNCSTHEGVNPVFPKPGPIDQVEYGDSGHPYYAQSTETFCEYGQATKFVETFADDTVNMISGDNGNDSGQGRVIAMEPSLSLPTNTIAMNGVAYTTLWLSATCPSGIITETFTITAEMTEYVCGECHVRTTLETSVIPCSSTTIHLSSSTYVYLSENSSPGTSSVWEPFETTAPLTATSMGSLPSTNPWYSDSSDSLRYATGDLYPWLPCVPGTFLCTSPLEFLTCDQVVGGGWTWQYLRRTAAGMECIPSLSGGAEHGQQPGVPLGYHREDLYRRARLHGSCSIDGIIECTDGGFGWMICDHGIWIDMGSVPAEMTCVNSQIV